MCNDSRHPYFGTFGPATTRVLGLEENFLHPNGGP